MNSFPPPLTESRLALAERLANALPEGRVATLEEVSGNDEPADAHRLLRELSRAGLVVQTVMNSGNCEGRREGPRFFYARTKDLAPALAAARQALGNTRESG